MERVNAILDKMASPDLYVQNDFIIGERPGVILASADLSDMATLMMVLKDLKAYRTETVGQPDYESLKLNVLPNFESSILHSPEQQMAKLLGGDALLFLDQAEGCLSLAVRKYNTRSVAEPPTSGVVRGPREGFIEDMKTNLSLIERKLRTPSLKIDKLTIGRHTNTLVSVVYIEGIAKKEIAGSIKAKLRAINIDGLIDTHYIQEFLDEHPYSIFPQSGLTEKPDIVASKLLEGRIAILVDGSPMVATVPYIFIEELQSGEDYFERSTFTTLVRVVRMFALLTGILLPGLYVALQEFHFDVLPFSLLLTIMNANGSVPFTPFGEILFVLLLFEIIREAGIRMPKAVGLAMSVVGALVLGDTAVKAGFIGSTAVMIVALSSIALYTVPGNVGSSSLLRLTFTLTGGAAGLFGIMLAGMFLIIYLCGMENYGAPYFAPFAPMIRGDFKDSLYKVPVIDMTLRPASVPNENKRRQSKNGQD